MYVTLGWTISCNSLRVLGLVSVVMYISARGAVYAQYLLYTTQMLWSNSNVHNVVLSECRKRWRWDWMRDVTQVCGVGVQSSSFIPSGHGRGSQCRGLLLHRVARGRCQCQLQPRTLARRLGQWRALLAQARRRHEGQCQWRHFNLTSYIYCRSCDVRVGGGDCGHIGAFHLSRRDSGMIWLIIWSSSFFIGRTNLRLLRSLLFCKFFCFRHAIIRITHCTIEH